MDSAVAAASTAVRADSMVVDSEAARVDSTVASHAAMAAGSHIVATASAPVPESAHVADMHADLRAALWPDVGGSAAAIMVAFGTGGAGVSGTAGGGATAWAPVGGGVRSVTSGFADS